MGEPWRVRQHGCMTILLIHDDLHVKPCYGHVSLLHDSGQGSPGAAGAAMDPSPPMSACKAPKCSREEGCSDQPPSKASPEPSTGLGHHLGPWVLAPPPPHGRATGSIPLHTSLAHGAHICTQTHNNFIFSPHPMQNNAALTLGAPRFTPHAQSASCPLSPLSTPQPGRAQAHLLLDNPVCLPKVFAAGGTCFDTISSAKEAAHLA